MKQDTVVYSSLLFGELPEPRIHAFDGRVMVLDWKDIDGRPHRIQFAVMHFFKRGSGIFIKKQLLDGGANVPTDAKEWKSFVATVIERGQAFLKEDKVSVAGEKHKLFKIFSKIRVAESLTKTERDDWNEWKTELYLLADGVRDDAIVGRPVEHNRADRLVKLINEIPTVLE